MSFLRPLKLTATFKTCKLFTKTLSSSDSRIQARFKEFAKWESQYPNEKFGSSDYPFAGSGKLAGFWHAKLSFDVSIIYRCEKNIIYLYGVFTHDEAGTGQPANKNKQSSLRSKLDNQSF